MSLYNALRGFNPLAGPLLLSLRLYPPSATISRFRDAGLYNKDREAKDYLIRVTTRTGGPNRANHTESIGRLTKHEHFLREEDDDFDHTYMYFYFKLPPDLAKELKAAEERDPNKIRACVENRSLKDMTEL